MVVAVYLNNVTSVQPSPTTDASHTRRPTLKPDCMANQRLAMASHLSSIGAFATTCLPGARSTVASLVSSELASYGSSGLWHFPTPTTIVPSATATYARFSSISLPGSTRNDAKLFEALPTAGLHAYRPIRR